MINARSLALLCCALGLFAHAARAEMRVENAWVRATPGTMTVTAGYGRLVNTGPGADTLEGIYDDLENVSRKVLAGNVTDEIAGAPGM